MNRRDKSERPASAGLKPEMLTEAEMEALRREARRAGAWMREELDRNPPLPPDETGEEMQDSEDSVAERQVKAIEKLTKKVEGLSAEIGALKAVLQGLRDRLGSGAPIGDSDNEIGI